ncbi:hypothetical protein LG3211_4525 [Lysobacter gummosus]|nr:hypothetical protein LG3211_4525 [Lysobacter gummosus]
MAARAGGGLPVALNPTAIDSKASSAPSGADDERGAAVLRTE